MTYPDPPLPPQPPPFLPEMLVASGVKVQWAKKSGSQLQFEHEPLFKRPRKHDKHPPNSASFLPMNPRTSQPNPPFVSSSWMVIVGMERIAPLHMASKICESPYQIGKNISVIMVKVQRIGMTIKEKLIGLKFARISTIGEVLVWGNCNFLHESSLNYNTDVAKPLPKDSSAVSIGIMGPVMEHRSETEQTELNKHLNNSSDAIRVKTKSYLKTRICSKWEITWSVPLRREL